MKVALISDIHGNLEALTAVLNHAFKQNVDQIYCLGDVIGYGPRQHACLQLVKKCCNNILRGNHEDAFLSGKSYYRMSQYAREGIDFAKKTLTANDVAIINNTVPTITLKYINARLCHASMLGDCNWRYISHIEEAERNIEKMDTQLLIIGHTHVPFIFSSDSNSHKHMKELSIDFIKDLSQPVILSSNHKYILNVGSVGQPRDRDCRSAYGIIEKNENVLTYTLHRVFYDIKRTAEEIKENNLSDFLAERLFKGG